MAITLQDVRGLAEPLRQYNYEFVVPDVPGAGDGGVLRIAVVTASIPGMQSEPFELSHGGFVTKHAGRGMYPRSLAIEYREGADLNVYNSLLAWHGLQWNRETGVQADESMYKTNALFRILDHSKAVAGTFNLEGVFIEDVGDVSMDYASSAEVRVPVTFSYDLWLKE